ncbi:hypothetical protein BDZ89DRAFT_226978 [Hymenopellis radicata]|nr:hypothetical protein BDZ89DRAFT_226978 [Hymenopellis radicata]
MSSDSVLHAISRPTNSNDDTTSTITAIASYFHLPKPSIESTRRFEDEEFTRFLTHLTRRNTFQPSVNATTRVIADDEYNRLLSTSPRYSHPTAVFGQPAVRGYHFSRHPTLSRRLLYQSHKELIVPRLSEISTIIQSFMLLFPEILDARDLHLKICEMYAFIPLDAIVELVRREAFLSSSISPVRIRSAAPSPSPSRFDMILRGLDTPPSTSPAKSGEYTGIDPRLLANRSPLVAVENRSSSGAGSKRHRRVQEEAGDSENVCVVKKKPRRSHYPVSMLQIPVEERMKQRARWRVTSKLMERVMDKPDMDSEEEEGVEMLLMFGKGRRMY